MFTSIKDWKNNKNKLNENSSNTDADKLLSLLSDLSEAPENEQNVHFDELAKISSKWALVAKGLKSGDISHYGTTYTADNNRIISNLDVEDISKANEYLSKHKGPKTINEWTPQETNWPTEVMFTKNVKTVDGVEIPMDTVLPVTKKGSVRVELDNKYWLNVDDFVSMINNGTIESVDNESKVNESNGSFTKLKFNSHTWHNPSCDILEGHLDSESFITYGIHVKDSNTHKIGDEFMEYYKGSNYSVDSKARSHSRAFNADKIPAKYKAKWDELKAIYEEKYKGKEHVKETKSIDEAYIFDFEEFMDTDLAGPAVESSILTLIDQYIDIVNNEIDKEGAGSGANLDVVKQQAYKEIARVWKNKIEDYLVKGIKFNA